MIKKIICIECPKGCCLSVEVEGEKVVHVTGHTCPKGESYAISEIVEPKRILASTVRVRASAVKLLPVRTDVPIPKNKIEAAMSLIRSQVVESPVICGEVVIDNILGLNANVIATRTIR